MYTMGFPKNINISKQIKFREIQEEALQMSLQISCKQTSINDLKIIFKFFNISTLLKRVCDVTNFPL